MPLCQKSIKSLDFITIVNTYLFILSLYIIQFLLVSLTYFH